MHAGEPGGLDNIVGGRFLAEARDIFGDRPVEQLDRLRQMADGVCQGLGRVVRDHRLVEADFSARRLPGPDEGAHQGRLAAAARSDDAERIA